MLSGALILNCLLSISGIWNAWGYNSGDWDELAPLLHKNGYDTVFYCAAYGLETDIEGLQECIEACTPYNIDVHAWVVMWKTGQSSDDVRNNLMRQDRLQVSIDDDARVQTWLCPTDPSNISAMASVCLEIAAYSGVKGIHLDYIRYASNRTCFCDGCSERFQHDARLRSIRWPDDCVPGGRTNADYNRWRNEAITSAVTAVRDSLNRLNKVVELSAAVLPEEREMNYYAQHWNRWLERGIVDFVVPMNYTLSDSELISWGENQLELAGNHSIPCGLVTTRDGENFTEREISDQQQLADNLNFDGWVMFHLSDYMISIMEGNPRTR